MLVELSARAEAEFLELVGDLSDYSIPAARRFIQDFEKALLQLRDFPESGHRRGSNRARRLLHVGVYHFRYTLKGDRVVVRRILDGRRRRQR